MRQKIPRGLGKRQSLFVEMTVLSPPRIVEPIETERARPDASSTTGPGPLRPTMTDQWFAEGEAAERALERIDSWSELPALYADYVRSPEPAPRRRRGWWALSLAGIAGIACTLGTLLVA